MADQQKSKWRYSLWGIEGSGMSNPKYNG